MMIKKFLSVILVCVVLLALCSCGFDEEKELRLEVNKNISTHFLLKYDNVKGVYANVTTIEKSGNIYTVYGVATVNDAYNEQYKAKFTGEYELIDKEFKKKFLDIETPTK